MRGDDLEGMGELAGAAGGAGPAGKRTGPGWTEGASSWARRRGIRAGAGLGIRKGFRAEQGPWRSERISLRNGFDRESLFDP